MTLFRALLYNFLGSLGGITFAIGYLVTVSPKKLHITKRTAYCLIFGCIYLCAFGYTLNYFILKCTLFIFFNEFLFSTLQKTFDLRMSRKYLDFSFVTIIASILILFAFPELQSKLQDKITHNRFSGFVGCDFIPFFLLSYHYLDSQLNNTNLTYTSIFKTLCIMVICCYAGRFAFIVTIIYFTYHLLEKTSLKNFIVVAISATIITFFIYDKLDYYYTSYIGLDDYTRFGYTTEFKSEHNISITGHYNLSPVSFYNEIVSIGSQGFLPSQYEFKVDSGPIIILSNLGIILGIVFYLIPILYIPVNSKFNLFLISILLVTDLKYHCVLSPYIMAWIYILQIAKQGIKIE